ncbi:MAG: hypothetical protein EBR82_15615 [Caulobacteraceae bacterium]|nr:hypothetical protein [Caulobacteraceae bacterium]
MARIELGPLAFAQLGVRDGRHGTSPAAGDHDVPAGRDVVARRLEEAHPQVFAGGLHDPAAHPGELFRRDGGDEGVGGAPGGRILTIDFLAHGDDLRLRPFLDRNRPRRGAPGAGGLGRRRRNDAGGAQQGHSRQQAF